MGAAGKPPPLVCFKWPWSPNPNPSPSPSPSPSPCGDLELPWLFKSIRTLSQDLLIAGDLPSPASSAGGGLWGRQRRTGAAVVEADRGDAEQRALAAALASGSPATVLEFYSPRCRLCASLRDLVRELEDGASGSASFVLADAEDDRWLPEIRPLLCAPGQARQSSSEDWSTNQPAACYRRSSSPPEDAAAIRTGRKPECASIMIHEAQIPEQDL
ncbi:uncharacterized protein [Miscanthus floridulus]|uniref:uncharacterized protein isoform X1 n=1 Tax=Miscanthus floridulus TaxID=154761 RepID=UPI0034598A23